MACTFYYNESCPICKVLLPRWKTAVRMNTYVSPGCQMTLKVGEPCHRIGTHILTSDTLSTAMAHIKTEPVLALYYSNSCGPCIRFKGPVWDKVKDQLGIPYKEYQLGRDRFPPEVHVVPTVRLEYGTHNVVCQARTEDGIKNFVQTQLKSSSQTHPRTRRLQSV